MVMVYRREHESTSRGISQGEALSLLQYSTSGITATMRKDQEGRNMKMTFVDCIRGEGPSAPFMDHNNFAHELESPAHFYLDVILN